MGDHTSANKIGLWLDRVRRYPSVLWRLEARFKGVKMEGRVEFIGRPIVSVAKGATIVLADSVSIASALRANPLGLAQPSVLRALAAGSELRLGTAVAIGGAVLCAGSSIEIGEQTIIGAGAMVIDNDFHRPLGQWAWEADSVSTARPIRIGRGVFIGARAIVLKGVTIGDRAVVGAGAVVTKDVPQGQFAVGNPARCFAARPRREVGRV